MTLGKFICDRRRDLKLNQAELCRLTVSPDIPSPIKSSIYISRLERGIEDQLPSATVSFDKMWALGVVLHCNPVHLFLLSRDALELEPMVTSLPVDTCEPMSVGDLFRNRRAALKLTNRDVVKKCLHWPVSIGYWSQMETDFRGCQSKISGEKLIACAYALEVDPLLLYVLSRRLDERLLNPLHRARLFS